MVCSSYLTIAQATSSQEHRKQAIGKASLAHLKVQAKLPAAPLAPDERRTLCTNLRKVTTDLEGLLADSWGLPTDLPELRVGSPGEERLP